MWITVWLPWMMSVKQNYTALWWSVLHFFIRLSTCNINKHNQHNDNKKRRLETNAHNHFPIPFPTLSDRNYTVTLLRYLWYRVVKLSVVHVYWRGLVRFEEITLESVRNCSSVVSFMNFFIFNQFIFESLEVIEISV